MIKSHITTHTLYTNVNFLILILYCSYIKCKHLRKLGEGHMGSLGTIFATSYESIFVSKENVFKFYLFIYLSMAVLGLRFRARAFSSYGKRGPLFIAAHGPLTIAASLVAEHRLQTRRLSNRGSRAQPIHGMWDLPRPGLEPVFPALAGRLSTTAPPGKPQENVFKEFTLNHETMYNFKVAVCKSKQMARKLGG